MSTEQSKTPYAKRLESNRAWKVRNAKRVYLYGKAYEKRRSSTPALRERKNAQNRASYKRHAAARAAYDKARDKIKVRARQVLRNHVFKGTLKRMPCEVCGNPKSHGHHKDYSKPLKVRWLCALHHKRHHHAN